MNETTFRLSDGTTLTVEEHIPFGWSYTLYDKDGTAITGDDILHHTNYKEASPETAVEAALQHLKKEDLNYYRK